MYHIVQKKERKNLWNFAKKPTTLCVQDKTAACREIINYQNIIYTSLSPDYRCCLMKIKEKCAREENVAKN